VPLGLGIKVKQGSHLLTWAGIFVFFFGFIHLLMPFFGPGSYAWLSANARMVNLSNHGSYLPALSAVITAVLYITWSFYAYAGAGKYKEMPKMHIVLPVVGLYFLISGLRFLSMLYQYIAGANLLVFNYFMVAFAEFAIGVFYLAGFIHYRARTRGRQP
jgi:hypothetical protein